MLSWMQVESRVTPPYGTVRGGYAAETGWPLLFLMVMVVLVGEAQRMLNSGGTILFEIIINSFKTLN